MGGGACIFLPYSTNRAPTSSLLRPLMTEVDSRLKTSSGGMTCQSRPDNSACASVMASWGYFVSFTPLILDSSMPKELIGRQNRSETLGGKHLHCSVLDRKHCARISGISPRIRTVYRLSGAWISVYRLSGACSLCVRDRMALNVQSFFVNGLPTDT